MIRSAVTISLVEQARSGPFVFHGDLAAGCRAAAELGYDAVEVFAPGPDAPALEGLKDLLKSTGLQLAAVGTGAGFVVHKLCLTSPEATIRREAISFIQRMIEFGGKFGAPAIIGSMQGRSGPDVSREQAIDWLRAALDELAEDALRYNVPLIYEPLNRYETNLINTLSDGVELLRTLQTDNVRLLGDVFHMNIEETDLGSAFASAGRFLGHVHFVDSNRRPAGCGHLDLGRVATSLRDMGYNGYASVEGFPWPDSQAAAEQAIRAHRYWFNTPE